MLIYFSLIFIYFDTANCELRIHKLSAISCSQVDTSFSLRIRQSCYILKSLLCRSSTEMFHGFPDCFLGLSTVSQLSSRKFLC